MTELNRRQLLRTAGTGAALLGWGPFLLGEEKKEEKKPEGFTLPKLPYAYDALEPHIDAQTMMIHHDKHHAAYVANLNTALAKTPALLSKSIVEILKDVTSRARGGTAGRHQQRRRPRQSHAVLGSDGTEEGRRAEGRPGQGDRQRPSRVSPSSRRRLTAGGMTQFGSGWAWLVVGRQGQAGRDEIREPGQPLHEGADAAPRHGRVGARLLPEVSEPPRRLSSRRGGTSSTGITLPCARRTRRRGEA